MRGEFRAVQKRTALRSAVESREETPKEGIYSRETVGKKILLQRGKVKIKGALI